MPRDAWNRCSICGRFISFDDFLTGKADAEIYYVGLGDERSDYWHRACAKKELDRAPEGTYG